MNLTIQPQFRCIKLIEKPVLDNFRRIGKSKDGLNILKADQEIIEGNVTQFLFVDDNGNVKRTARRFVQDLPYSRYKATNWEHENNADGELSSNYRLFYGKNDAIAEKTTFQECYRGYKKNCRMISTAINDEGKFEHHNTSALEHYRKARELDDRYFTRLLEWGKDFDLEKIKTWKKHEAENRNFWTGFENNKLKQMKEDEEFNKMIAKPEFRAFKEVLSMISDLANHSDKSTGPRLYWFILPEMQKRYNPRVIPADKIDYNFSPRELYKEIQERFYRITNEEIHQKAKELGVELNW